MELPTEVAPSKGRAASSRAKQGTSGKEPTEAREEREPVEGMNGRAARRRAKQRNSSKFSSERTRVAWSRAKELNSGIESSEGTEEEAGSRTNQKKTRNDLPQKRQIGKVSRDGSEDP